jgi:hypothetical protein
VHPGQESDLAGYRPDFFRPAAVRSQSVSQHQFAKFLINRIIQCQGYLGTLVGELGQQLGADFFGLGAHGLFARLLIAALHGLSQGRAHLLGIIKPALNAQQPRHHDHIRTVIRQRQRTRIRSQKLEVHRRLRLHAAL